MVSPFGGVPPDDVTVAMKVIACPITDGFGEELMLVVVAAAIFSLRIADVLPTLLESPLYCAVMEYVPPAAKEVMKLAMFPLSEALPSVCDPARKVTVPLAIPPYWPPTVAVKVTA